MKKDKFIFYGMAANILVAVVISLLMSGVWSLTIICLTMFIVNTFFFKLISDAMTKPVKLFTPVPVKLNDEWCFTYYLVEGSSMISPQELFRRRLNK